MTKPTPRPPLDLREALESAGISRMGFVREAGVNWSTFNSWWQGARALPAAHEAKLRALAAEYGLKFKEIEKTNTEKA